MDNKEKNKNKNKNEIEIVIGDETAFEISEVNDCMNSLRPQNLGATKKKVIIPSEKKVNNKKED